jgi:hypothetical protein
LLEISSKILVKKFGKGEKSVTFAPAIKATFIARLGEKKWIIDFCMIYKVYIFVVRFLASRLAIK